MDFMKILDQTVREIKREVNLKVLKVPEIEQKVLDATNDEAWGPHGTALSEIAQATKKFTECQLIMNVLWTRLTDTGPNWRHVYKALTVIEYLVANGSERAVEDILEHSFQITAISGFEYVEPNGKDVGINVRKKVETILALLNDREKMKAIRDKASANRDKYVGLSSTGITSRSSSASYDSSSFYKSDHYGSGSREGDSFRDNDKEAEQFGKESRWKIEKEDSENSQSIGNENEGSKFKKKQESSPSTSSKIFNKPGAVPSKTPNANPSSEDDDFADFDPRGSSAGTASSSTAQTDLLGTSLVGDLMDATPSFSPKVIADASTASNSEVDLFADATFQSASQAETTDYCTKGTTDPFAGQHAIPASFPGNVDLFAAYDTGLTSKTKPAETVSTESFDPFAAIKINNFSESDPFGTSHVEPVSSETSRSYTTGKYIDEETFGEFTPHTEQTSPEPSQISSKNSLGNLKFSTAPTPASRRDNFQVKSGVWADCLNRGLIFTPHTEQTSPEPSQISSKNSLGNLKFSTAPTPASRRDNFQVKSGVWADCLNRGLIDLNISAPKKVNLSDIGIVGGLEDASNDKEKSLPTTTAFMGKAMGSGAGLSWSGYSTATGGTGSYATFGQQQFGSFK